MAEEGSIALAESLEVGQLLRQQSWISVPGVSVFEALEGEDPGMKR